jgi:hypothetical protein
MEEQKTTLPAPGIGRVFRKAFGDVYDYLGLVVAASFVWLVASLVPLTFGIELQKRVSSPAPLFAGVALSAVVAVCLGVGLFYLAHRVVHREDPGFGDLLMGFKALFLPSVSLALVDLIVTGLLAADIGFFFGLFKVSGALAHNPVFFSVGIFFVWVMAFWLMTAMYHGPLLVSSYYLPELEVKRPTTGSIIKRGVLLALGAPFFTLVFLFAIIAVTILAVGSRIGMAIFVAYPGIVAIVLTHATRALFIRYGVLEERPEVVEDEGWKVKP